MTERLFFALWPDAEQRHALEEVQQGLSLRHARESHPQDFHITLIFLGDVAADQRSCAENAANRVRGLRFRLELDRVGCFPPARAVWCGPSARPQGLLDLVAALYGELLVCGFHPERRPYAPHVTLARKARPLAGFELDEPIIWAPDGLVLAATGTGPPPRYRVLRRWPLL